MRSRVKRNLLTRAASSEMAGVFRSDWRKKSQVGKLIDVAAFGEIFADLGGDGGSGIG